MMAKPLTSAKRVVVKIGSALLVDETSGGIRRRWLEALADDVAALRNEGKDVILVSSGAIAVGRRHLDLPAGSLRLEMRRAFQHDIPSSEVELGETIREVTLLAVGPNGRISPLTTIPLATA